MSGELTVKRAPAISWSEVGSREAALISRCAAGEDLACTELVTEHQRMVFHLALHLLGDHDEALDLSQEVFLNVFRTIGRFRGQSALRTWIYRIVINQARNRQRWWRRRHRAEQVSLEERLETTGDLPAANDLEEPDRLYRQKELSTRIWGALDRLPFDQRTVVVLREIDGLSYDEIGFSLGVAVGHGEISAHPGARGAQKPAQRGGQDMMARGCRHVRRQLSAFHDGELPVGEQIAVQAHLRECPACAAEAREIDDLGSCLRAGVLAASVGPEEWSGLPSMVVSRLKAEDAESFFGRTGRVFEDLHLVWAALGATGATVACLALIFTIFYYAISSPAGSNGNPVMANAGMNLPSASSNDAFPATAALLDKEDLAFALDAVVTREGRIAKLQVIQPGGAGKKLSKEEMQAAVALLDAISKARFEPARYAGSPVPVAVNMVWLYASLTVKAKMPELQIQPKPSRSSTSLSGRTVPPYIRVV